MNRARLLFPLALSLTLLFLVVSLVREGSAVGYTPEREGELPAFATPAALAAQSVVGLGPGTEAWVTNQGVWTLSSVCALCTDPMQCVVAGRGGGDGGQGCWVRSSEGAPGAQNVPDWYIDPIAGDDTRDCMTVPTSCLTLDEPLRRVAQQRIPALTTPTFHLLGDFSNTSLSMMLSVAGGESPDVVGYPILKGQRIYTGSDGGPLGTFTLQSYTAWDGGARQEGIAYVAAVDGGPAFDPAVYNTAAGYMLEDTTAPHAGLGIAIGQKVDAGTFNTPAGDVVQSYVWSEPAPGDSLRLYTLTKLGTSGTTSLSFYGTGAPLIENVELGSGAHSIQMQTPATTGLSSLELDACIVNGLDVPTSTFLSSWGSSYITSSLHLYGYGQFSGTLFTAPPQARNSGYFVLYDATLIAGTYTNIGCDDGPATLWNSGNLAVTGYSSSALHVCGGSRAWMGNSRMESPPNGTGQFWARNGTPGTAAIEVQVGAVVSYNPGSTPASNGAPWILAGVVTDAGLPLVNTATFSGIMVQQ